MEREPIQFPRGHAYDRAYWLSRCEGFLLEDAAGVRIGRVVEVHYESRLDQPDALAVRAGRLGLRLLVYPTAAVQTIVPAEGRLVLTSGATPVRSGRAA